ncbi:MAG: pyruvate formate lyase family protein [Armatimonadia bacterium]
MSADPSLNACVPTPSRPRGSTVRTARLAAEVLARLYTPFTEYRELSQQYQSTAPDTVRANAETFSEVFPRLTPLIREDELIVGAKRRDAEAAEIIAWFPDGQRNYAAGFAANTPPDRADIRAQAERGLLSPQGSLNHKVVDYAGFIRTGSRQWAQRAREAAEAHSGHERDFALAMELGHLALIRFAHGYATECLRLAETADPGRAEELRSLAEICRKVPAHPAETFHEALQSLWFAYMVAGDGVGRPDVYLWDFYQADLQAGRITPEQAQELIECLLIKLHGDYAEGVYNVSSIHTLTLGGVLPDGSDATNDLTRLFLQAIRSVRLLRPTIYVRLHEGTPQDVLELAVEMLGEGLSEPNFYGDKPILEGLTRIGVPLEGARDYALSGCTEVVLPGKGNWGAPNGWINLALLIDDAIRELAQAPEPTEELLWQIIERRAEELAETCRVCNTYVDEARVDPAYNACLFMPCCLDSCRDLVHGGADSYFGHWEAIGLPNSADMLYAARQLVFEGQESLPGLLEGLDAGDDALICHLRKLPRFGTGHESVDEIAGRLVDLMSRLLEQRSTPLREALVLGHLAGGENMHLCYGQIMGPTLDGRRAGETLADSLAGSQGVTTAGPTGVIRSLCRLDHSRLIAGNVSTLRLLPADFADAESRAKVISLIRTFVSLGGSQLQINVLDRETLLAAQEHPEDHAGLMVRVAGYSADFTHLGRPLQDEIIARCEVAELAN